MFISFATKDLFGEMSRHPGDEVSERSMQRGSIESGLVIIPTTLFFLMALQLLLAGSWQTIERAKLHDIVVETSIKEFQGTNHFGAQGARELSDSTSLLVQDLHTPVGTIRTYDMSTDLPIFGDLFSSFDNKIFRVKNYAVSFIS